MVDKHKKAGRLRLADAPGMNPELCCLAFGKHRQEEENSYLQSSTRGEAITLNTTIGILTGTYPSSTNSPITGIMSAHPLDYYNMIVLVVIDGAVGTVC